MSASDCGELTVTRYCPCASSGRRVHRSRARTLSTSAARCSPRARPCRGIELRFARPVRSTPISAAPCSTPGGPRRLHDSTCRPARTRPETPRRRHGMRVGRSLQRNRRGRLRRRTRRRIDRRAIFFRRPTSDNASLTPMPWPVPIILGPRLRSRPTATPARATRHRCRSASCSARAEHAHDTRGGGRGGNSEACLEHSTRPMWGGSRRLG